MKIDRMVIASKNPDKIAEMEAVLVSTGAVGEIVRGLDWEDVEENGSTLEENALLKARAVAASTGIAALADDTGLMVDALGGEPGVYSGRYSAPDATYEKNVAKLLSNMEGIEDRTASFRTVVAVVLPDGEEIIAVGVLAGVITTECRGDKGFGYDPVFEVDGLTLAEISAEHKNAISHRGRAIQAIAEAILER